MTKNLGYILCLLTLISCTSQHTENQENANTKRTISQDSQKTSIHKIQPRPAVGEPFKVADIDKLEFTSGGAKKVKSQAMCDSSGTGFFGAYHLIDRNFRDNNGLALGGMITIHSFKKMSDWKSVDTNQTIWKIHLKSDVIAVWDSIKIGLSRKKIETFTAAYNGLCIDSGETHSCTFYDFSADFMFKQDTLKELTITRNCTK